MNQGDSGKLSVSAPVLQVDGGAVSASTLGDGNAGNLDVQVGQLTLTGGAIIFAGVGARQLRHDLSSVFSTGGPGRGGKLTVNATEAISISGHDQDGAVSGLYGNTYGKGDAGTISVSAPILQMEEGSISAGTLGDGNGGNIDVQAGQLALGNGAEIASTGGFAQFKDGVLILHGTGGPGRSGDVTVTATEALSILGRNSSTDVPSGLFTNARKGSGDGGHIFISAPILELHDGAAIASEAFGESTGNAGDIRLEVGRLTLTGGAFIISGTDGLGHGGDIQVQARQVELNNDAFLGAESFGAGDAGNLQIHAADTFHSRNSVVSTESELSGGGKIDLSAGQIVELVDSQITTTVQGGSGDAGNITIDPRFVILNNSQVIAQAVEGKGGNIHIGADVFLASPASVVDASSRKGISGTIDIRGAVSNLSGSIAPLPQGYLSTAALVEDRCAGRLREGQVSSFVVAGREGMPLQPGGVLPSPLYEAGQVGVQGGPVRNEGRVVWQVPKITPIALDGGCGR